MSRRRRKRKSQGDVELNLAAMLDMAFQLLAFFIFTFKPSPVEGQVSLRLPPPQPVTNVTRRSESAGSNESKVLEGLNSLMINVLPSGTGGIGTLALNDEQVGSLSKLDERLRSVLSDKSLPFEQVIIQVGSGLRYDALMSIIDVCTRQKLPTGEPLTKLSFVELSEAAKAQ